MKFELSTSEFEAIIFGCTKGSKEEHQTKIKGNNENIQLVCVQCGMEFFFHSRSYIPICENCDRCPCICIAKFVE